MNTQQEHPDNKQENERLRLDNVRLKDNLEKEELLHKTLYKQWTELNALMLAKEREFEEYKPRNLFYKYAFYAILFLIAPAYYFLSNGKGDEKITPASKAASSATPPTNQTPTNNLDTAELPAVQIEEKKIIKRDTIQPKMTTINKPVTDKPLTGFVKDDNPLTDSARDSIYWQGWNAYYEKSRNPYQRYTQKFQVWLEGWKDGENDANKLTKDSL